MTKATRAATREQSMHALYTSGKPAGKLTECKQKKLLPRGASSAGAPPPLPMRSALNSGVPPSVRALPGRHRA